jgi:hypothetical protein
MLAGERKRAPPSLEIGSGQLSAPGRVSVAAGQVSTELSPVSICSTLGGS